MAKLIEFKFICKDCGLEIEQDKDLKCPECGGEVKIEFIDTFNCTCNLIKKGFKEVE